MYAYSNVRGKRLRTYQVAVDLLSREDFPTAGLLTHTFPLRGYRQVFQTALDKRHYQSVKVAVDLRQGPDTPRPGITRKFS